MSLNLNSSYVNVNKVSSKEDYSVNAATNNSVAEVKKKKESNSVFDKLSSVLAAPQKAEKKSPKEEIGEKLQEIDTDLTSLETEFDAAKNDGSLTIEKIAALLEKASQIQERLKAIDAEIERISDTGRSTDKFNKRLSNKFIEINSFRTSLLPSTTQEQEKKAVLPQENAQPVVTEAKAV